MQRARPRSVRSPPSHVQRTAPRRRGRFHADHPGPFAVAGPHPGGHRLRRSLLLAPGRPRGKPLRVPRRQPTGPALRRPRRRRPLRDRRNRLRHRPQHAAGRPALSGAGAGRRRPGTVVRGKAPAAARRPGPRPGPLAGAGRARPGAARPVPARQPRLSPAATGGQRHPNADARRRGGPVAPVPRRRGRLVPGRLRPGPQPGHVAGRPVRRTGRPQPPRRHPGHLHRRRLRAPGSDRGGLRHAAPGRLRRQAPHAGRPLR